MPNYVSPGVFVIEKDISQYAPTVNSSVVGVVGFASKGPVNKATLITSPQQLIDTFGEPSESLVGQGLEGSLEILEQTNSLYYVRAANDSQSANASSTIQIGGCPAVKVRPNDWGTDHALYLKVWVTNNAGVDQYRTPKKFSIPAGTSTGSSKSQGAALRKVIGGSLDSDKVSVQFDSTNSDSGYIVGSFAGSGASLKVIGYSDADFQNQISDHKGFQVIDAFGYPSGTPSTSVATLGSEILPLGQQTAFGVTIDTGLSLSGLTYQTQSLHPGGGYNAGTKSNGGTSGNSIEIDGLGGPFNILTVNDGGVASETFKVSFVANKEFVEDKINTSFTTDLTSDVIQGSLFASAIDMAAPLGLSSFIDNASALGTTTMGILGSHGNAPGLLGPDLGGGAIPRGSSRYYSLGGGWKFHFYGEAVSPRFVKMMEGTYNMAGGDNGVATDSADRDTDLIGDASVNPKTGMQSLDDAVLNISLAIVPGITSQNTQNALITLAESTQAFLAIISPPHGMSNTQTAIDWSNGQSDTRTASVASNYAAVYWPWVQSFSVHDGKDRWYDPAIFGVRQMVHTDAVSEPWFAPAGFVRGRLTKPTDVEVRLNQGDRDSMYSGGNILNPIVNFVRQGITIFGQRTAQRNPTALDRINVRRLLIQIRKVILAATTQFIFEPNDEFTWNQIEGILNPFLDDIKRRRGIVEFRVVCDATTNTPARVDRNELWCKVLIKPTKTAEILIFEVNLTNQSAQLGGE